MSPVPRIEATLEELVAIDSTSTRTNAPVVELLEKRLSALGFECRRHPYKGEDGVEKINLVSVHPERGADQKVPAARVGGVAELQLVGHTDCVPFDPSWKEALTLTQKEGKLYGRGACDTKAFISCVLTALDRIELGSLKRPLGVVFTADEELGCFGAKKLVEAGVGRARYAIVGEPTSLRPIRANKGYCLAEIEVLGKEGHSAYPETGASAIFRAGRLLKRLEEWAWGELRQDADPSFSPPHTTVNVGTIAGGRAKNVIPGSCRFVVEWRPIPRQDVQLVGKKLEAIAAELAREERGFEAKIRVVRADRGVETPESAALVRFLSQESGKAPDTVAFGTEAPQMTALGAESVVFGPGDIKVAHQTGEFVPIDELLRCADILERAIRHFCG